MEEIQFESELLSITAIEQADTQMEFHLVSWNETHDDTVRERYGMFVSHNGTGTLIARFEPDVSLEVAISTWVAFGWSGIVTGTDRAAEIVHAFMNPEPTSSLVIPDTATVEAITK